MTDPLGLMPNSHVTPTGNGLGTPKTNAAEPTKSFKDVLMKNIEQVNRLQQDAEVAIEDLTTGKRDDVDAVLMAKQKADIAFQMLLQVRNKVMDAYEEVKQIRV